MKLFKILLSVITIVNAYNVVNIKNLINRPIENSIISFIKIGNINNLKIKNHTNYLILNFNDDYNNVYLQKFNDCYDIIKDNKKPLLIINNKNINNLKTKYTYIIKNKNDYYMKYTFDYNNKKYKYLLDISAYEYNKYETLWDISAIINTTKETDKLLMTGYLIKNWIDHIIYQENNINDTLKKYIILYYFLNIK
jgi:hypothetical protein